jgi:peptidyl-prolyl cis-trans isomerase C
MSWRRRVATLLREPLVHFLIAGAAVFALFGGETAPDERRIVIDAPRIERLAGQFAQTFRRLPSEAELDALIREDVKDEVYYREALRLGLDRDDVVVKRRMRNKLEAMAVAPEELEEPDDATLQRWLDAHPERFAGEARYSFEQRPVAGPALPLPARFADASSSDVAAQFGGDFVTALDRLPSGRWSGPVPSPFGPLRVLPLERTPAASPKLDAIRQRVENDWRAAMARQRTEAAYRALLERYDVVIDKP